MLQQKRTKTSTTIWMYRSEKWYLTMGSEFLSSTVHDHKGPRERSLYEIA